jgi:hypothetical protein
MLPAKLLPQQYAAPDVARPHVWEFAGAIMENDMAPETRKGQRESFKYPLPRVPKPEFHPQHKAAPPVVIAHVW